MTKKKKKREENAIKKIWLKHVACVSKKEQIKDRKRNIKKEEKNAIAVEVQVRTQTTATMKNNLLISGVEKSEVVVDTRFKVIPQEHILKTVFEVYVHLYYRTKKKCNLSDLSYRLFFYFHFCSCTLQFNQMAHFYCALVGILSKTIWELMQILQIVWLRGNFEGMVNLIEKLEIQTCILCMFTMGVFLKFGVQHY